MTRHRSLAPVCVLVLLVAVACACSSAAANSASTTSSSAPKTTITLNYPAPYTPSAPNGGTDDYHCTLEDPNLTQDSMIVGSHFYPGSYEVHHAIFYLVPANLVPEAEKANDGGKGWTCFGDTDLAHTTYAAPFTGVDTGTTPWLAAWAPGLDTNVAPPGTGAYFPKGTMVVEQIHYNLLLGDKPVAPKLVLTTVPAKGTTLDPLQLDLMVAPPDVPCPAGATGPLCSRSAAMANIAQRFGAKEVAFDTGIETICGRNPLNPPVGPTTTCTWPVKTSEYLLRLTAHMHLMGQGMQIVLNPGTPSAKTLLNVTDYDFHFQRSYDLSAPVYLKPGDNVQITCTYDSSRELTYSTLDLVPPHFVIWGEGSTDEMCLGILQSVKTLTPQVKP